MKFENKIVIVTGASSGMGRQIALDFAKNGATVVAAARRKEKLESLKDEAIKAGFNGTINPFVVDLSNEESTINLINETIKKFNGLDILVNNAGSMDDFGPIGEVSDELLNKVFAIDLYSPFYSSREACKYFLKSNRKGNIINIGSIAGLGGGKAGTVYTMAKHAIVGMTKSIGYQYRNSNIRCNCICPGGIATAIMSPDAFANASTFGLANLQAMTAMNVKPGTVNNISDFVMFLASDESSYITGAILPIDGGLMGN